MLGGELRLKFGVVNDAPFLQADEEGLSGLQPPLVKYPLRLNGQHAHFGGHDDQIIFGNVVARWAQAVSVERGADGLTVGEGDGGRAVPRFHHTTVILVEGLLLRAHRLVPVPGLWDHQYHRVGERVPPEQQELQCVVEAGGIATFLVDNWEDALNVFEQRRCQKRFASPHPVDIAAQGVYLSVVRDHPIGMGQPPAGERVSAEARVEHNERALHPCV